MERALFAAPRGAVDEHAVPEIDPGLPVRPVLAPERVVEQVDARGLVGGEQNGIQNALIAVTGVRAPAVEHGCRAAFGPPPQRRVVRRTHRAKIQRRAHVAIIACGRVDAVNRVRGVVLGTIAVLAAQESSRLETESKLGVEVGAEKTVGIDPDQHVMFSAFREIGHRIGLELPGIDVAPAAAEHRRIEQADARVAAEAGGLRATQRTALVLDDVHRRQRVKLQHGVDGRQRPRKEIPVGDRDEGVPHQGLRCHAQADTSYSAPARLQGPRGILNRVGRRDHPPKPRRSQGKAWGVGRANGVVNSKRALLRNVGCSADGETSRHRARSSR